MISKIAVFALAFSSLPTFSTAASPQWLELDGNRADVVLVDRSTVTVTDGLTSLWVLRSFRDEVTLGNDAQTGEALYPHRSAKLHYVVDCARDMLGFDSWRLYSGNLADGELVWSDQHENEKTLVKASSPEEHAVLARACSTNTASNR